MGYIVFNHSIKKFGAALGFGRSCTRQKLYRRKKGLEPKEDEKNNPVAQRMMDWGKEHEPEARKVLEKELQAIYKRPNLKIGETGIHSITRILDGNNPRFGASPDGMIKAPPPFKSCTVEIKCPTENPKTKAPPKVYPELVEFDKDIGPRLHLDYYIQVQAQMRAVGCKCSFFICWTPTEYAILLVHRNDIFFELVLRKLDHFVDHYLIPGIEPPRFTDKQKVEKELQDLIPNNSIILLRRAFV
jgi:hypothetical protein